jgi:hypothetical protein
MVFRGAMMYIWALGSAQRMQSKAVHRVLYAPLGFFLNVGGKGEEVVPCWRDGTLPDCLLAESSSPLPRPTARFVCKLLPPHRSLSATCWSR